jgi:hypothetical protein
MVIPLKGEAGGRDFFTAENRRSGGFRREARSDSGILRLRDTGIMGGMVDWRAEELKIGAWVGGSFLRFK